MNKIDHWHPMKKYSYLFDKKQILGGDATFFSRQAQNGLEYTILKQAELVTSIFTLLVILSHMTS